MARCSRLHSTQRAPLACAFVLMMLAFTAPAVAAGRRMAASDRPGAAGPAATLRYGQATIYRSDEAPKSATQQEPDAAPPAPSQPKDTQSDALPTDLPVLIHGVPHRAALHYSSSVC